MLINNYIEYSFNNTVDSLVVDIGNIVFSVILGIENTPTPHISTISNMLTN